MSCWPRANSAVTLSFPTGVGQKLGCHAGGCSSPHPGHPGAVHDGEWEAGLDVVEDQ
jgi:hypothetical protein